MKLNILRSGADRCSPSLYKRAALCSLLFLFAAHAFCFLNLTYSSGSVMLHVSSGRSAQIAAGQYLQPVYRRIRGSISSPMWVGILSCLYLTITNLLLIFLLQLTHPVSCFALCGVMTVNAAVLSICAASLHTADAVFLSLLLAALASVCCMRVRLGVLPSLVLLTGALALDPGAAAFFAALTLIAALSDLLRSPEPKAFALSMLRMLLAFAGAALLYLLGYRFLLARNHLDVQTGFLLFGGDPLASWLAPLRALFAPLTAYPHVNVLIQALLFIVCVLCLFACWRTYGRAVAALLTLGTLALPLFCALRFLSNQPLAQITPAFCLFDIWIIVLASRFMPEKKQIKMCFAGAFAALFLGSIVFSNQVYLKKNLEFESTLSLMSRVISRLEETEGFHPGLTPVAIIGTPEDSIFSIERKGFEHLSALDAASGNYAIADDMGMIWYSWEIMGYPLNFVSTYELEQLKQLSEVQALPAFPAENCCTFIGDVLVIRLS